MTFTNYKVITHLSRMMKSCYSYFIFSKQIKNRIPERKTKLNIIFPFYPFFFKILSLRLHHLAQTLLPLATHSDFGKRLTSLSD